MITDKQRLSLLEIIFNFQSLSSCICSQFDSIDQFRDKILMNLEKLSTKPLCADDLELLKQWKWNFSITADQGYGLATEGFAELREIGERFQQNFPNLFVDKYDPKRFHFQHTDTERTRLSFRSFAAGIFDESAYEKISAEPPTKQADLLLKVCRNEF